MKLYLKEDVYFVCGYKNAAIYDTINGEDIISYIDVTSITRDLMDKNSGKSYNLVTIPPNTKAGDIDISGYHFYPLYVNQSPFKENMYTLPYEKDRNILLMKGNEKIIIKAGVLKEALNENYKQFVKDKQALNNIQKKQKDELEI